ncbi:uncharacterized protein KGF55_001348 [Candida pseudojiufengensis]|uniref:uncharacterized protein n=1 Tax=Candida pseudojiufengensis TaxID=497109 RepID=UPI002224BC2C|nr:uncharacterized protein KGF55_001348 [Candida pseudojiufengensis]KAI5965984.1 hypothetical protein KGF55_001348 [Candida pseudojiufengensis]
MKLSTLIPIVAFISTISAAPAAAPAVTSPPQAAPTDGNNWSTYPSVAKTASINGFADKIYDQLPSCAQPCVRKDTRVTPCPYWDTGCLCVMPQFAGPIGDCIASACKGDKVKTATSLATSICSSAGVWEPYWMIPPSVSKSLSVAAEATD